MRKYETWDEFMDRAKDNGLSPTLQETIDKKDEVNMNTKERKVQPKSDEFQELQFKESTKDATKKLQQCKIKLSDGSYFMGELPLANIGCDSVTKFLEVYNNKKVLTFYNSEIEGIQNIPVIDVFVRHIILIIPIK